MAVILLILKIIGITLLLLLGLLLLVLALVLFVPMRYRIGGKVDGESQVRIAVTWLLHLVSFRCVYEAGEMNTVLRIMGIRFKNRKATPDSGEDTWDEPDHAKAQKNETPGHTEQESAGETQGAEAEGMKAQKSETPGRAEQKSAGETKTAEKRKDRFRRKHRETKRSQESSIGRIKGLLANERHKIVLPLIWEEVKYMLLHFKFRKIKADLTFSLGDPALTGQALGAMSVLPFLYQYEIQIVPDFVSEKTYVRGNYEIRGYARGMHLVRSLIRLIRKKEFRNWLKQLLDR